MTHIITLGKTALFAQVPPEALQALERVAVLKTYQDGQCIMIQGDHHVPVFLVLEGTIRAFRASPDGREQILHLAGPGEGINIPTAFSAGPGRAPASAVAVGQVRLLAIPRDDFARVVSETPALALAVLRDLSNKLQNLTGLAHDLSLRSVRGRLARFILQEATTPSNVPMRWTHEAIAMRIGTVREVVSRTMRDLVKSGLIKMERQRIVIQDRQALEREAEL